MKRRKATVRTPVDELNKEETLVHHLCIKIEALESSVKVLAECMQSGFEELRREFAEQRREMDARFQILEAAIKCNTEAIRQDSKDISFLKAELRKVETHLSEKIDRIGMRLDDHDRRITKLESPAA